jgi:hypothetical protein
LTCITRLASLGASLFLGILTQLRRVGKHCDLASKSNRVYPCSNSFFINTMLTIYGVIAEVVDLYDQPDREQLSTIQLPRENITKLHIYISFVSMRPNTAHIAISFSDTATRMFWICGRSNAVRTYAGKMVRI